ncbi:AraC family transcriptional regulator [Silvibacterium bohemicum]|uniref:AraC family transcriptional regulator n=1 Tax=Silvibacterium bohemicum TaxID=1577686 RepID=A0A841K4X3_9BACT|nr:AraC family transcriptional regulator [Silvibacterium bohemicum]MBB6145324.1 AraC family transcriptional regulator [Silvibacterium bohemicum]
MGESERGLEVEELSNTPKLKSSASLRCKGLYLGEFHSGVDAVLPSSPGRHVIFQLKSGPTRGEHRLEHGTVIPFTKKPETITLVPAGPAPRVSLFTPADFIYCAMDREFIGSIAEEMDRNYSTIPSFRSGVHNASIEAILQLLSKELETGAPSGALYVDSLAHALGVRFVLADEVARMAGVATTSGLPPHILIRVQNRIEAELGNSLTLEALSQESGYSKSHFLRMFQSAVGQTPHQYVLARRLHRAQQLLKREHLTIAEVALSCGFSSQAHMTDAFRKQLQTTPGEYRRNS